MRRIAWGTRAAVYKAWWWLRQVSGDAAYENYLQGTSRPPGVARAGTVSAAHGGPVARASELSPEEFYLDTLERKYARPCRCC
jgi:hypothetical protein